LKKTNLKTLTNRMTRSKLTFIVYGDMFDIDEFSKIINISPTEFAYKGDKLKFRISTDTFWKYSFKDIISLFVEDSLKPLKKRQAVFKEKYKICIYIFLSETAFLFLFFILKLEILIIFSVLISNFPILPLILRILWSQNIHSYDILLFVFFLQVYNQFFQHFSSWIYFRSMLLVQHVPILKNH